MTRLETGLLDLAESFLRNDDVVHDADYQTLYSIATDVGEVESENAKLRELVDILCFCMQIHKRCDDCKLNGAKGELGHDPLLACDGLHEMLKELGIEVDG